MPWEPSERTKTFARAYLVPAAILAAIVLGLNLAFAHLTSPAEKISACAFAVSAMTLFTTLGERRGTLRSTVYGKRVDAIAESARLLATFYRAVMLVCIQAEANGAETEDVRTARQRLDAASDAYAEHLGARALYFEDELLATSDGFLQEAARFYRAYNAWAKNPQDLEVLTRHKRELEALHAAYFDAARHVLGLDVLTADAKRIIGSSMP